MVNCRCSIDGLLLVTKKSSISVTSSYNNAQNNIFKNQEKNSHKMFSLSLLSFSFSLFLSLSFSFTHTHTRLFFSHKYLILQNDINTQLTASRPHRCGILHSPRGRCAVMPSTPLSARSSASCTTQTRSSISSNARQREMDRSLQRY